MKHLFLVNLSLRQNCRDQAGDKSLGPSRARLPRQRYSRLYSLFRFLHFSFLPHKRLIPGTRLRDLTPVTSHPGPSGNSQRHFFLRNLTEEEGGEEVGGASEGGRAGGAFGQEESRRVCFLLAIRDGWSWQGREAKLPPARPKYQPLRPRAPLPQMVVAPGADPRPHGSWFGARGLFPSTPRRHLCQSFLRS